MSKRSLPLNQSSVLILILISFLIFTLFSCTKSGPIDSEERELDVFCSDAINKTSPKCAKACVDNPGKGWCMADKMVPIECPTDGSFVGVNLFTHEKVELPATPIPVQFGGGSGIFAIDEFSNGETNALVMSEGSKIYIGSKDVSIDLGSPVTGASIYIDGETNYVAAGTTTNLKLVPFSFTAENGGFKINADGVKTFDQLGGILNIVVKTSPDILGAKKEAGPVEGLYTSVNVPAEGGTAIPAAGNINFVYVVAADGNVWRIKLNSILAGGCVERIFDAAKYVDDTGHKMVAQKVAAAGQYVAIFASTAGTDLKALPEETTNFWNSYVSENGIAIPIAEKFHRLAHQYVYPGESAQKIFSINLLTNKDGTFKSTTLVTDDKALPFVSDISIGGNRLYVATFNYDTTDALYLGDNVSQKFESLANIWKLARGSGIDLMDTLAQYGGFIDSAGPGFILVDLDKPETPIAHGRLGSPPLATPDLPAPFFATITAGNGSVFFRAENRYLAIIDAENVGIKNIVTLENGSVLTPYSTIFNSEKQMIITTFITELEKIRLGETIEVELTK